VDDPTFVFYLLGAAVIAATLAANKRASARRRDKQIEAMDASILAAPYKIEPPAR
jgi:hypothetical protein